MRELAFRSNGGVEVSLLWNEANGQVVVMVHDERSSESFELAVTGESALDAFHHPYAYAASRGVDYALAA